MPFKKKKLKISGHSMAYHREGRGDADPSPGAAVSEKLHQEIPGSKLVRISTGGHFIQEDEPDRIAHELISFFRGNHVAAG